MADSIKRVKVVLEADASAYERTLRQQAGNTRSFAQQAQQTGATLTRTLTPAAIGMGLAFRNAFQEFDSGADALRAGTGATGRALEDLTRSMRNVAGAGMNVLAPISQVGETLAEVSRRTGATGKDLETLTARILQLGQVGNAATVEGVTRTLGDWSIAVADSEQALDELFRVSQLTGPSVDRLGQLLVQYGAPLRELGFGFEDAALLMGKFEQEGVNTELAMGGLRIALGQFAREGKNPIEALDGIIDAIQGAGTAAEANAIAMQTFGARAGVDMARAISEGRFELDDLRASLDANHDTVAQAAEDTIDLGDRFRMLATEAQEVVGPFGEIGMGLAGIAAGVGPAISAISRIGPALSGVATFMTGPWGLAIAGATVLVGAMAKAHLDAQGRIEAYTEAVQNDSGALGENTEEQIRNILAKRDLFDELRLVGVSIEDMTDAIMGNGDAFDRVHGQIDSALGSLMQTDAATGHYTDEQWALKQATDAILVTLGQESDALEDRRRAFQAEALAQSQASEVAIDYAKALERSTTAGRQYAGQLLEGRTASDEAATATDGLQTAISGAAVATGEWGTALDGFLTPVGAYETAIQTLAQQTADATADASDSWQDHADDVDVSLDQVTQALTDQLTDQWNWSANMASLAGRMSDDTLAELARLGPEAAPLVAELATATDAELRNFEDNFRWTTEAAVAATTGGMEQLATLGPQIAARFGQDTVDAMSDKLRDGTTSIQEIVDTYQAALASGINPILIALGEPEIIHITGGPGGVTEFAAGGKARGGVKGRDSVNARLTPDEWVIQTSATSMYGDAAMAAVNEGRAVIGFASGGKVTGDLVGLHPEFLRRLSLWSAGVGQTYNVGSGYRSLAEQQALYEAWLRGDPGQAQAAPPGKSNHNYGLASDGPYWGSKNPGAYGLTYPMSYEPWHVEPFNAKAMRGTSFVDLPPVPSVAPYASYLGESATAVMSHARSAAQAWLEQQFSFPAIGVPGQAEGGGAGGSAAANMALGEAMNAARGWAAHWPALKALWQGESGWNQFADNPTSSAYGIAQFLDDTWASVGGRKTSDPRLQIAYGLDYIAQRYGNPSNALAKWQARSPHWYDQGGLLPPGLTTVMNGTGRSEAVFPLTDPIDVNVASFASSAAQDVAGRIDPTGNIAYGRPLPHETQQQIAANSEMLRIEALSPRDRLAEVNALLADTIPFTDEWVALLREAERLEGEIADAAGAATAELRRQHQAAVDFAEAAARTAQSLADDLWGDLNRALDRLDQLDRQAAEATARWAQATADAQRRAADDITRLIEARQRALFTAFGDFQQRFTVGWGNTVGALTAELDRRYEAADEAFDRLAELRSRGVSEGVIAAYGLDDPANLASLRMFTRATDTELARLNEALARQETQAAEHAHGEADLLLGALGAAILDVQDDLADTLDGLNTQLQTTLSEIAAQAALVGQDTGRGYADAMAAALSSGMPAVIAIAQQFQQALADAEAAQAALAALTSGTGGRNPIAAAANAARPGTFGGGLGGHGGMFGGWFGYDSGGILPPGPTLAWNATGRDEYVLTPGQLRSLAPAAGATVAVVSGPVAIMLDDGRQLSGYIRSEANAAARADTRTGRLTGVQA